MVTDSEDANAHVAELENICNIVQSGLEEVLELIKQQDILPSTKPEIIDILERTQIAAKFKIATDVDTDNNNQFTIFKGLDPYHVTYEFEAESYHHVVFCDHLPTLDEVMVALQLEELLADVNLDEAISIYPTSTVHEFPIILANT